MNEVTRGGSPGAALQGHRAGFASRLVADVVDFGVAWLLWLSVLMLGATARYVISGPPFDFPDLKPLQSGPLFSVIAIAYLTAGWAGTGRTVGKQLTGLRALHRTGNRLSTPRALLRAVLYVLFPAGLLWVLISRGNYSVQDLLVRTVVIYDWRYHAPPEEPP